MKQIQSKSSFLTLTALLTLLAVVVAVVVVIPKASEAMKATKTLETDKATLARLTTKLAFLEGLEAVQLQERNDLLLSVMPSRKDPVLSYSTIKILAQEASLADISINVSPGLVSSDSAQASGSAQITETKKDSMSFDFEGAGSKDQLMNFFARLEAVAPLMLIKELELTGGSADVFLAKLRIESFFYDLPLTLGKIDSPLPALTPQEEVVFEAAKTYQKLPSGGEFTIIPQGKDDIFKL